MHALTLIPGGHAAQIVVRAAGHGGQGRKDGVQLPGVLTDDVVAGGLQRLNGLGAAGHLPPTGEAVVRHQLDDDAQRIGRVQPGGVEQGRIGNGNRRDVHVGDTHEIVLFVFKGLS